MKLIPVKKENRLKLNTMSDAQFYFSWYQIFNVLIFAATRRSILYLYLDLLHQKTLFTNGYKGKAPRGYSEKL